MSPAKAITSPLRFVTPGQLAICLVLFFLPWVEVQCPMPKGNFNFDLTDKAPAKPAMPEMLWTGFVNQSGFQAATGGYSFSDSTMQQMAEQEKGGKKESVASAPILWGYLFAVLAGIGIGFAMPLGSTRKVLLLACCAVALISAGGQAAMGFPIAKEIENEMKKDKGGGLKMGLGGDGFDLGPPNKGMPGLDMQPKTVLKFPFFIAILLAVGALVTTVLEPTKAKPVTKTRGKYDFDDDEDEATPEAEEDEGDDDRDDRRRRR